MLQATSLLPALALAATAVAQVGWTQLQPSTRPPARAHHATTYDVVRGVTVLFGGQSLSGELGDTWEWNGANWTQRVTSVSPPARYGHALAFDISRARVVVFGGATVSPSVNMNDTWEFDGNHWIQVLPASTPSPRRLARMEYDAARGRIVLFGGALDDTGSLPIFGDTWEWNGVTWTMRSPAMGPTPRWGHGMAYDFVRARIVMCGGMVTAIGGLLTDTWTWDGTNWSQLQAIAPGGDLFGLASDPARDVVVRCGLVANSSQTWLFDHVAWRRDPRTATPPPRLWFPLTHDLLRGRTVKFGGRLIGFYDDTWEYDPGTVARWTAYGSACAGTAGVPALRPVGASLPIVGTTFQLELLGIPGNAAAISFGFSDTQWNGGALPFDLGALGMTGCTLHASPDIVFFAPVAAGRATLAWPLPNDPSLTGVRFFDQGFVLDPGVNPTGATVSNAGAATIGPF